MSGFSRREFIQKICGSVAALFVANRAVFSLDETDKKFEILVIGDSLIFGQGLKEENKTYSIVKTWLQSELKREVKLNIKAHSGARISLHEEDLNGLKRGGKDDSTYYNLEVPLSFPSIESQIKLAEKDYEKPQNLDLIMLTGGITDLEVADILNGKGNDAKLKADIVKYCRDSMFSLLAQSANAFPNAKIIVVGYYPPISNKSKGSKVFNAMLELYKIPRPLKPFVNNVLTRQFLKGLKKRAIKRSQIWFEDSNREFQNAVAKLNEKFDKPRAFFVKSPIDEETCYGTKNTLLWEMGKKGKTNDEIYDARKIGCIAALDEITKTTKLKYPRRFCELSGLGHPNIEGSKAYAEAIKEKLKQILP
jgi:lysophospholipase L1-like esterase